MQGLGQKTQEIQMSIPEAVLHYQNSANSVIKNLSDLCMQNYRINSGLKSRIEELEKENKELKEKYEKKPSEPDANPEAKE
jgi:hypothetical protein